MNRPDGFTFLQPAQNTATADVVQRFIDAFARKDASAIGSLVAPDCVMEAMQPAPDGLRVEGFEANVAFWQAMIADPIGSFESEEVAICGDRAINRWRYHFGGDGGSVRGVTLIRVHDGKIAEALGYAKTPPVSALGQADTADIIRRFNDAFANHDGDVFLDLVAEDCVIENLNGTRHVGRKACLALWQRIATDPKHHFTTEEVLIAGERATIRWHLDHGDGQVRGVNVMRLRDGKIVEAMGYGKLG